MPFAAETLLEAIDRYPREGADENRVTELFAAVLRADPELMAWLVRQAWGGPAQDPATWVAAGYRVTTQVVISPQARPDMEIRFTGKHQPPGGGRLLCEHKLGALETEAQLQGYTTPNPDDRLLAIKSRRDAPLRGFRADQVLTWTDVARAADALARASERRRSGAPRRWRERLGHPDAIAGQLRRHELIAYLQRKDPDVGSSDPLTSRDIATLCDARTTLFRIRELFDLIVAHDELPWTDERRVKPRASFAPGAALFETKEAKDSWYVEVAEAWPAVADHPDTYWGELMIAAYDDWVPEPIGEPALAVGYGFDIKGGTWPPGLAPGAPALHRLAEQGITIGMGGEGWIGRVNRTLYLGELTYHGASLAEQADWAAAWIAGAFASINAQPIG